MCAAGKIYHENVHRHLYEENGEGSERKMDDGKEKKLVENFASTNNKTFLYKFSGFIFFFTSPPLSTLYILRL